MARRRLDQWAAEWKHLGTRCGMTKALGIGRPGPPYSVTRRPSTPIPRKRGLVVVGGRATGPVPLRPVPAEA